MKLRTKMITTLASIEFLLFLAISFFLVHLTGGVLKDSIIDSAQLSAEKSAQAIEGQMSMVAQSSKDLANLIDLLKLSGRTDRDVIPDLFMDMLDKNPDFFAIWAIFEPNKWDGKDRLFAGSKTYRTTGRFYPWAYRDENGKPSLDLAMAEDGEETGPYYSIPFESGKSLFIDPYAEQVEGTPVLMTTYSVPLTGNDGNRYGVVGIDISHSFLSTILANSIIDTQISASIIAPDGTILADTSDVKSLGTQAEESSGREKLEIIKKVSDSGKPLVLEALWGTAKTPVIEVLVPIILPGSSNAWVYAIRMNKAEVFAEQTKALIGLIFFFLAGIALMEVGVFFLTRQVSEPIQKVSDAFVKMEDGDLTIRVPVTTRDEIGALAKAFNLFSIRISFLFRSVKQMTFSISNASEDLEKSVYHSREAVSEIRLCVNQTNSDMDSQTKAIKSAQTNIESITEKIDDLAATIEQQVEAIAESSSCVEEMVGNIQSLALNTETVVNEFSSLSESSQTGKARLNAVTSKIEEVALKSKGLAETNQAVAEIAEQTSLLAINAAIEAAHAGNAGRGFAVVAKEIKALSERARERSKRVSEQLNGIEAVIADVSVASVDAKSSFENIMNRIERVNSLENEAYQAVREQKIGSEQVLVALTQMQSVTDQVKTATASIRSSSGEVHTSMQRLNEVSSDLVASIQLISDKADEIDTSSSEVLDLALANKSRVATLAEQVVKFQFE